MQLGSDAAMPGWTAELDGVSLVAVAAVGEGASTGVGAALLADADAAFSAWIITEVGVWFRCECRN